MKRFTAGTVGRGKAIHAVHAHGAHQGETVCGKTATTVIDGEAATTCKSCRSALPSWSVTLTAEEIAELQPIAAVSGPAIVNTRTGVVRHILGTSLTTNAPHKTVVWVQRAGERGVQAWSADELMSTWHDLVAIDADGDTPVEAAHAEALEIAEIIEFEQAMYDLFRSEGWGSQDALDMTESCRNLDSEWSDPTAKTKRYDELLRKHGSAAPFVVRTS